VRRYARRQFNYRVFRFGFLMMISSVSMIETATPESARSARRIIGGLLFAIFFSRFFTHCRLCYRHNRIYNLFAGIIGGVEIGNTLNSRIRIGQHAEVKLKKSCRNGFGWRLPKVRRFRRARCRRR